MASLLAKEIFTDFCLDLLENIENVHVNIDYSQNFNLKHKIKKF